VEAGAVVDESDEMSESPKTSLAETGRYAAVRSGTIRNAGFHGVRVVGGIGYTTACDVDSHVECLGD